MPHQLSGDVICVKVPHLEREGGGEGGREGGERREGGGGREGGGRRGRGKGGKEGMLCMHNWYKE